MANIRWHDENALSVSKSESTSAAARRSGNVAGFPQEFLLDGVVEIADSRSIELKPGTRRSDAPQALDFSVEGDDKSPFVTVIRHPSGAVTFHAAETTEARRSSSRAKTAKVVYHFRCPCRFDSELDSRRRGLLSKVVKVFVLKVVAKAVEGITSWLIPTLATAWEEGTWKKLGLSEGWHHVTSDTLRNGRLKPVNLRTSRPQGRALLFLHGTFSNASRAFGSIDPRFFAEIKNVYGDNLYAFNHFTVSKTPEQNARDLLQGLPNAGVEFDVITHSRGGLVLRNLVERKIALGANANRINVERVVLVASPNEGTPLATPDHWDKTVGFFANFVELFPDNPFTTAVEFVSEAILWIAKRATGDLPGIASMDRNGTSIEDLQLPPSRGASDYFALVANYHPDESIWARISDVGIDGFFGLANDLVVPSDGGWRVGDGAQIGGENIGCFGSGGNLNANINVHHGNFFSQPETVDYLISVLRAGMTGLSAIDPDRPLPDRRFRRSSTDRPRPASLISNAATVERDSTTSQPPPPTGQAPPTGPPQGPLGLVREDEDGSALNLVILPPPNDSESASILATYSNARVLEEFHTSGGEAGKRWRDIINFDKDLKQYIDGTPDSRLPTSSEILDVGTQLFETLFPGNVRRIYDVARSSYKGPRLPVILTSMIPWVADKPWEFAYDSSRNSFLATEEIHFIRNVLTAIPAEQVAPTATRLRILVVVAQPVAHGQLSAEQEISVIRRSFASLIESGLVEVEVLPKATPSELHRRIRDNRFDVIHCICHGDFDEDEKRGYLIFESSDGNPHKIDERIVREIMCQRGIRMVFLNACETGSGGHANFNKGVAQSLVAGGMPAVVANQYKVLDLSATAFSKHFYWCIAQGLSIGEAAREARISVRYERRGELIDWAVPVIYARNTETRLCEVRRAAAGVTPTGTTTQPSVPVASIPTPSQPTTALESAAVADITSRSLERPASKTIAVWDINYSFPELESTLEQLNAAQDQFHFQVVSLSLPLSARVTFEDDDSYLNGDAVAERLKSAPHDIGVDFLACITNEPMACIYSEGTEDDEEEYILNIYDWADETGESPIFIFSTAGLDIPPAEIGTARAITSFLVFSLTTRLAEVMPHRGGSKHCPMYYNEERDPEQIMAAQKFDKKCRDTIGKKIPREFSALEAMLDSMR